MRERVASVLGIEIPQLLPVRPTPTPLFWRRLPCGSVGPNSSFRTGPDLQRQEVLRERNLLKEREVPLRLQLLHLLTVFLKPFTLLLIFFVIETILEFVLNTAYIELTASLSFA